MRHLTLEQLLQLREPGVEPGSADAREHLAGCAECQAEARRLDQRVARLRALPSLRPARDHWGQVRFRLVVARRRRRWRWVGVAAAAAVAGMALVAALRGGEGAGGPGSEALAAMALDQIMAESNRLEAAIQSYNPEARVTDGLTARVAGELENRIARVDRQLELAQMLGAEERDRQLLRLWRERVGLLDALVDVHLTRASRVGM
jgi:hypothetical protein